MKTLSQGIIPIFKPSGIASFSVTSAVKRKLGVKTGHYGTLDPLAEGVLPVMFGAATRLSEFFPKEKEYLAELTFGIKTDTGDVKGRIIETAPFSSVSLEKIEEKLPLFTGNITQTPPIYSALSVDGKKLYKYALKGEKVDIKPRVVNVTAISAEGFDGEKLRLRVKCGSGTYIRTLCEDIASSLGTVGTMSALRRTLSGGFYEKDSVPLEKFLESDDPYSYAVTVEDFLSPYGAVTLDESAVRYFQNGGVINRERVEGYAEGVLRVYGNGVFLGLGKGVESEEGPILRPLWHYNGE